MSNNEYGPFNYDLARSLRDQLDKWCKTESPRVELTPDYVCEAIIPALDVMLGRPPFHVIDLRADGWTLMHPLIDEDLFGCPYTVASIRPDGPFLDFDPSLVGKHRVSLDAEGLLRLAGVVNETR